MSGTTLCPHCHTRFKITEEQLEAHHGMVRCGHCLQAFDAMPDYISDKPHPQLELPILDEPFFFIKKPPVAHYPPHAEKMASMEIRLQENLCDPNPDLGQPAAPDVETDEYGKYNAPDDQTHLHICNNETAGEAANNLAEPPQSDSPSASDFANTQELSTSPFVEGVNPDEEALNMGLKANQAQRESHGKDESFPNTQQTVAASYAVPIEQHRTLAEQVTIVHDEEENTHTSPAKYRKWPWMIATILLVLGLVAQAAYFFRIDLAARLPDLKPGLVGYCHLLRCSVPLPQKTGLMSIESSDLEANPTHENQITLNALLRNRAPYAQAYPNLELTLNDTQDKPMARRIFIPSDYLPSLENEQIGLLSNHELSVKLYLNISDLRPTGYRLVLFYPHS